jgi:Fe-S oxidoreductase
MEESKGQRINQARSLQAQECGQKTGSLTIAVNCPFCMQMFDDGIPSVELDESKRMKSYDVAELLEQAVIGKRESAKAPEAAEAAAEPPAQGEPAS